MAELTEKPFPPGRYPLVVVGSGPGALQLTYSLRRLGVEHAVISDDPAPGGMFRRWPVFQLMLFFFQAEDGIRDGRVTGVQTGALPIFRTAMLQPGMCSASRSERRTCVGPP